ncbi:GMC oxidoreductase [Rhizobium tubonense]|uniref:GMC oxidoreductase n=1 Tax=Rhizobium tubonense TaxID=484088 RepID=UPI0019D48B90|nr:GMC oxidoreductase [Rhizobium tubonense]
MPGDDIRIRDDYRGFARRHARSAYHPVGTCRTGGGEGSVVDPDLKVRGIEGPRVCDSSIMPQPISSNTNATTIMIGEKAADLKRGM